MFKRISIVILAAGLIVAVSAGAFSALAAPQDNVIKAAPVADEPFDTNLVGSNDQATILVQAASESLTSGESAGLLFMYEEEKLARDVYLTLSEIYSLPVFKNISKSEQVHMDKVLCLLVHYNIEDPASEEIGVFSNPDLQSFYNSLIDLGTPSLIGALTAGATIEDYDIHDLNHNIELTENIAIITIFEYLVCGSGNHMRAFSSLLNMRDVEYTPKFISPEEYSIILESEHQFCGLR